MRGVDWADVPLWPVPVVLSAVVLYGATTGEDALSLAVGTLVLVGWVAMVVARRRS